MSHREQSESVERIGPHGRFREQCGQRAVQLVGAVSVVGFVVTWAQYLGYLGPLISYLPALRGGAYTQTAKKDNCNDFFKNFIVLLHIDIQQFIESSPDLGDDTTEAISDLMKMQIYLKKIETFI